MPINDLLKHANDDSPVEFSKEFNKQLDAAVQSKLFPKDETSVEEEEKEKEEDKEDNEDN